MFIIGVGTAVPHLKATQKECLAALVTSSQYAQLAGRSQALLRKVLGSNNGIESRYFTMDTLTDAFDLNPNALHKRFAKGGPELGAQAAKAAIKNAGIAIEEIDAVVVSTCTGYICPGLTSYISEKLGCRPGALNFDLVGQGCGAALPNLKMAEALIHSDSAEKVLSISVEICSAALYLDNDPGVLISACLFGDGAGAVVVSKNGPKHGRKIQWGHYVTTLNTHDRDLLRFEQRDGMLRNILDKTVPLLVVEHVREVLTAALNKAEVSREDINGWIIHAGGRDVLAAVQSGLQLQEEDLRYSSDVLRLHGNISSPSVIFTLERALAANHPAGKWFVTAFGAGISAHGALLEVS
ncbi:MAG: type III polyketide synthase [Verrucomicrobiales bacterium]